MFYICIYIETHIDMYCTIVLVNWLIAKCNEHSFTLIQAHSFTHTPAYTQTGLQSINQKMSPTRNLSNYFMSAVSLVLSLALSLSPSLLLLSKNSTVYYF